jgi:DNA-binding response OmpR family regulator
MQGNDQRRILIVDDEPGLRDLVRINLEHEGFSVLEAESGAQGLQMVREQHPDLMILDVMMPEMDGWEVCRRSARILTDTGADVDCAHPE